MQNIVQAVNVKSVPLVAEEKKQEEEIENNLQKFLSQRSDNEPRDPKDDQRLDDSLLKDEPKSI